MGGNYKRSSGSCQSLPKVDTNTKEYRRNKTYREVEASLKEKLRLSSPGEETFYSDSSRNISVGLECQKRKKKKISERNPLQYSLTSGSKDIKSSLRGAKLPNGQPMLLDEEQNSLALLIEQARYELNCGDPKIAETYMNQAMTINDLEPLVKIVRGGCKVRLSRALEALEDVDPVLDDNPKHPLALHVKADALYHLGNFEHALVFYQRGLRNSTQDPEIFRLGIRRATKAIKNAIGPKVLDYFNTMSEIVSIIPQSVLAQPPHQISKFTKEEKKTMPPEASSSRPFLGPLNKELKYLKDLQNTTKTLGLGKASKEASHGISFLGGREEFWRQHTPLYVQKFEKM